MRIIAFGRPITQGNLVKTRWGVRDGNGDILHPWRDNVRSAAVNALRQSAGFGANPVKMDICFTFARPASHFGTGKNAGVVKASAPPFPSSHAVGDLDKCARAILDALTDAGVFKDDSQVVGLDARKCWVGTPWALDRPGAVIHIQAAS